MKTTYRVASWGEPDVGVVGTNAVITIEDNNVEPFSEEEHRCIKKFLVELFDVGDKDVQLEKEEDIIWQH